MYTFNEKVSESCSAMWGLWYSKNPSRLVALTVDKDLCGIRPASYHPWIEPFQSLEKMTFKRSGPPKHISSCHSYLWTLQFGLKAGGWIVSKLGIRRGLHKYLSGHQLSGHESSHGLLSSLQMVYWGTENDSSLKWVPNRSADISLPVNIAEEVGLKTNNLNVQAWLLMNEARFFLHMHEHHQDMVMPITLRPCKFSSHRIALSHWAVMAGALAGEGGWRRKATRPRSRGKTTC